MTSLLAKRFNVRCERGSPYFYRCLIFKTLKGMRLFLHLREKRLGTTRRFDRTEGLCSYTGVLPRCRYGIGIIVMSVESERPVTIATHELTHAAIFYWTRGLNKRMADLDHRGTMASKNEERFCRISQELHRTFWLGWQRRRHNFRKQRS